MFAKHTLRLGTATLFAFVASNAIGHGLMVDPPSRNAICGLSEQADNATTPACVDALANSGTQSYEFMSVLTHDIGRKGSRSEHVCSFDSESWNESETAWDKPVDWPTNAISPGTNEFVWNISWGPHFDDTEEFVYYITKPDFVFQVGVPLTWDDFEAQPFCDLGYDDNNPTANPLVVSDKAAVTFTTTCDVPERSGRHVIYGEWGRNQWTYERFHGCIDVVIDGDTSPVPTPIPTPTPTDVPVTPTPTDVPVTPTPTDIPVTPTPTDAPVSPTPTPTSPPTSEGATCEHVISSAWGSGFQAELRIINNTAETIYGWEISWSYSDGSTVDQLWNANHSESNGTITASNVGWNATIEPGQTMSFGYIGSGGSGAATAVTGDVCK